MSRRYASMVARLRPFSMVSHCKYSVRRVSGVVKVRSEDSSEGDDSGVVDGGLTPKSLAQFLTFEPSHGRARFLGASGRSWRHRQVSRFEDRHELIGPTG